MENGVPTRHLAALAPLHDTEVAPLDEQLFRPRRFTRAAACHAHMKSLAFGFADDQVDHPGIRVRTVEHRAGAFDHFDSLQQVDRKGLQDIAADSALDDLAHRTPVDEDQNVPRVGPRLVSPHGHDAAVGEEGAAAGESPDALQDRQQAHAAKAAQFVPGHHRHHAGRAG